jgi:cytidylate kinase
MIPVVTIDGPSGSGKGTISKALAIHLGWNYLDSGLIYRCFAYLTMIGTSHIPKAIKEIKHNFDLNKEEILFNGENITSAIRGTEVTMLSSKLSQKPEVRLQLIEIQKTFREHPGLVAEGRDMSSKLFPDSLVKIYLTADLKERVNRRANQLRNDGQKVNISELRNEIILRDKSDSERENSPLEISEDSVVIQNDSETVEDAAVKIINLINERY